LEQHEELHKQTKNITQEQYVLALLKNQPQSLFQDPPTKKEITNKKKKKKKKKK
jgi:hypothetical protein